ncbi:type II toxin-antitoxin system VapC family toxin [Mycolicibacterium pulveris]|uniref:type II toxin-antitoxin system VapC family toxin n=1 Tax=Mycolicibacterium pulveris TaxID=36813 RepID=UPI003CF89235
MNTYLDSSALVKLIIEERESRALKHYLTGHPNDNRLTAAIARTELVRAVAGRGAAVENARTALAGLNFVAVTTRLLDVAATLKPLELRALDAIHLAAAMTVPDLRALVTYDTRLAAAAAEAGVVTVAPT